MQPGQHLTSHHAGDHDVHDDDVDGDVDGDDDASGLGGGGELLQQIWGGHCETIAGIGLILIL